jgi:hypothetical protein
MDAFPTFNPARKYVAYLAEHLRAHLPKANIRRLRKGEEAKIEVTVAHPRGGVLRISRRFSSLLVGQLVDADGQAQREAMSIARAFRRELDPELAGDADENPADPGKT